MQGSLNSFVRRKKAKEVASYRSQAPHKERSPHINVSLNNTASDPPVSLQININNNVINVPHGAPIPPINFSLTRKLKPRVIAEPLISHKRGASNRDRSLEMKTHRGESSFKKELDATFITPKEILQKYSERLTNYEKGEILDYDQIYYFHLTHKGSDPVFSDKKGFYNIFLKDHIAYRYEILQYIGKGSFGQALKCFDHKEKQVVAVKILRDKKKLYHQGIVEAKILKFIRDRDAENKSSIVHMIDYFIFRRHIVITFELLSINLYTLIANNNFKGLSLGLVKRFAVQLLTALAFLRKHRIIHCDLKPENILLEQPNKSAVKLIDFGSSCFLNEQIYTYIQSRFYRAPEIMLGIPYTTAIDMWSFGCILSELFTGSPLFPGNSEPEQMAMILEVANLPPNKLLAQASRREVFFRDDGSPIQVVDVQGRARVAGSRQLSDAVKSSDTEFLNFLQACLVWDPEKRLTPEEAFLHPWIAGSRIRKMQRRIPVLDEASSLVNTKEKIKKRVFRNGSEETSSGGNARTANAQHISEAFKLSDQYKSKFDKKSSIPDTRNELPPIQEGTIKISQGKTAKPAFH
eukprot:TRINITY_DN4235_c0_g4_i1.p1 TRINITY_DN4235_c0_g4~~TRINITY_DN4235_c0_g4_i1.p1  ORF type:complete len:578 (-),score=135.00 TRINITY_DN4235_c0_g4_i1:108-1841(-)